MISQKAADANINLDAASAIFPASRTAAERYGSAIIQLVKKVSSDFSAKLLSELQNQILQYDFAILPLRRVIERERTP